jgi:hypothetical protein
MNRTELANFPEAIQSYKKKNGLVIARVARRASK